LLSLGAESFVFQFATKNLKVKNYRTIILPVFLYGCETWSLTTKEERMLWVLKNWTLRRIFGSKRDEVTGEWRKLRNEELIDVYCSLNIARMTNLKRMRWEGNVERMGEESLLQDFVEQT